MTLATLAAAADITGTVTNRTSNQPAARADVILLKLAQGMEEAARTKTDSQGRYRLTLDDANAPHLIRVVYQDATYHKAAPPGVTSADIDVYDAAAKVPGVRLSMNIVRLEPQPGQLNVMELYVVKNESKPPRTQMSDRTFEFTLPPDAKIDTAIVASPSGMPVNGSPIPGKKAGEYGFMFALRPGETRFQVGYHVPYSGSAQWKPPITGPLEHFVVMVPKSVTFTPADPALYSAMDDASAVVRVATNVDPKQNLAFSISGTGTISESEGAGAGAGASGAGGAEGGGAQPANGRELPGGGLGKPIDAPNPLEKYIWWILGGFIVLLAAGAWFFYQQPAAPDEDDEAARAATEMPRTRIVAPRTAAGQPTSAARTSGNGRSALLLDALKEEMFALETDRATGKLSAEEYQQHKAALDLTLQRALSRQK
ncbi:MAG: carboxypeptidase-like regulatory domain-containing protein [Acidobacteriota bacterium]|nr:carboxypeptidase-like regulatory domain-containing protein [Acidobacteriota bacterium]